VEQPLEHRALEPPPDRRWTTAMVRDTTSNVGFDTIASGCRLSPSGSASAPARARSSSLAGTFGGTRTDDVRSVAAMTAESFELRPIGWVESPLTDLGDAPAQGDEGAPNAVMVVRPEMRAALRGLAVGDRLIALTWLDRGDRAVLQVHPRSDTSRARLGVFATRSPDRPNPIGIHEVTLYAIDECALAVGPLEAVDGTPVLDIKPVLGAIADR
jgi:tRNA-Thr(GGU) m(6)t(6)A37 methyltransferase TsaA